MSLHNINQEIMCRAEIPLQARSLLAPPALQFRSPPWLTHFINTSTCAAGAGQGGAGDQPQRGDRGHVGAVSPRAGRGHGAGVPLTGPLVCALHSFLAASRARQPRRLHVPCAVPRRGPSLAADATAFLQSCYSPGAVLLQAFAVSEPGEQPDVCGEEVEDARAVGPQLRDATGRALAC